MAAIAAERNLLFGLLALQNGLINQGQLVAAFQAWTLDKARALADHFVDRGDLDADDRSAVEALMARHLKKHSGDVERSLAAIPAGRSTRESLARIDDPDVGGTLAHLGSASTEHGGDADRTASYAVGEATSEGQRFRVLRPHARGGLGAVFVALDTELHREVALKQILDSHADDAVSRQRFLLEAEITGGLEHPGIVPVYGLGSYDDGRPFYAMRFIKGDSFKEAVARFHADETLQRDPGRRSLELRKLLRRFLDVCNAIDYAHARGVLHRDIKPGNVIVGRYGETLVVDWGLAKATGRHDPGATPGEPTLAPSSSGSGAETLPGQALGTPAYMSPEQASGELDRLGPASDVYSLGASLYCLLTGKPPFDGEVGEVLRQVQRGEFAPPRSLEPLVDRALEAVCLKAMSLKPGERYASCRELADDVEHWLADEPVAAWREPLSRRARRWAKRNRTAVTAAAATLVAGVVALAAVLAVQSRAKADIARALVRETRVNTALAAANAELTRSTAAVQARYGLAVDAIKTFHTGVSEDFLLKQDQFKGLRDRLLRSALDFYGKLGALLGKETDLASRRALAQAEFEVAELTAKVGRKEDALAAHRRVLADRERLAEAPGSGDELRADLGMSLLALGRQLAETGRADEGLAAYDRARLLFGRLSDDHPGEAAYRDALARAHHYAGDLHWFASRHGESVRSHGLAAAIWESLAKAHPEVDRYRDDQARSENYRGVNLLLMGRREEARASLERARATIQQLVDNHPADLRFQVDLATCVNNIAVLMYQEDQPAEALAALQRALEMRENVAGATPAVAEFQHNVAKTYGNIGVMLMEAGRVGDAAEAQSRSVAILQKLVDDNPTAVELRRSLANGLNETGDILRLAGRTAEARAPYERALSILEGLVKVNEASLKDRAWMVQGLKGIGATRLADGRPADAVAAWRRAVAIGEKHRFDYGESLYYLACCHALLGGSAGVPGSGLSAEDGPAEQGRATELLNRAVTAGFRDGTRMRRDPDLDPLRGRDDFRLLMMDLAMPADPFARAH
jgi:serine/threonine-protein kinase